MNKDRLEFKDKMADKKKKKEEKKIILERVYNVPLRKEWLKSPKNKRAKKAVTALKKFLVRHMKSDKIKVAKSRKSTLTEERLNDMIDEIMKRRGW